MITPLITAPIQAVNRRDRAKAVPVAVHPGPVKVNN